MPNKLREFALPNPIRYRILGSILLTGLLVACGGGGGGGGGGSPVTKVWGTALAIDGAAGDVDDPQIAVHTNGNAIAVWEQDNGSGGIGVEVEDIWVSHYDASTGRWSTALMIESGSGTADDPQIAMDATGNAIVVWEQLDSVSGFYGVWAIRYDAAAQVWGTSTLIGSNNIGDAGDPQIAIDAAGRATAVWYQQRNVLGTIRQNIRAARYTVSGGWSAAETIDNANGDARGPKVAMDATGNAMVVWTQFDSISGFYDAWVNRYDYDILTATGSWGTAELIEGNDGDVNGAEIAISATGNAFAVWQQLDANTGLLNVHAVRYEAGAWGTAVTIEASTNNAYEPHVAMDSAGNALVVWEQSDGTRNAIWASRYDVVSRAFSVPTSIVADLVNNAEDPRVVLNASGDAIAVWEQDNGTGGIGVEVEDIWANRLTAGVWGTAERIETGGGDAYDPRIGMDANGNAIVVWEQDDSSTGADDVIANTYR